MKRAEEEEERRIPRGVIGGVVGGALGNVAGRAYVSKARDYLRWLESVPHALPEDLAKARGAYLKAVLPAAALTLAGAAIGTGTDFLARHMAGAMKRDEPKAEPPPVFTP